MILNLLLMIQVSTDFNAPDQELCYEFMDEAILKRGVNLIDTAEQYPIPSGGRASEGDTEKVIGSWIKDRKVPRSDVVVATKITGGSNITPRNIRKVRFLPLIFVLYSAQNKMFSH